MPGTKLISKIEKSAAKKTSRFIRHSKLPSGLKRASNKRISTIRHAKSAKASNRAASKLKKHVNKNKSVGKMVKKSISKQVDVLKNVHNFKLQARKQSRLRSKKGNCRYGKFKRSRRCKPFPIRFTSGSKRGRCRY